MVHKHQWLRPDREFQPHDLPLPDAVDEFGDGIELQILTVFPSLMLQQTHNALAVRHMVPSGTWGAMDLPWTDPGFANDTPDMRRRRVGGETAESQSTRLSESAVRRFWQTYRAHMGMR